MRIFGIILIVVGIAMLAVNGFNYQTKEKVVDLGPLEVNKTESKHVGWPAYAGGLIAVLGVGLLIAGRRDKNK